MHWGTRQISVLHDRFFALMDGSAVYQEGIKHAESGKIQIYMIELKMENGTAIITLVILYEL